MKREQTAARPGAMGCLGLIVIPVVMLLIPSYLRPSMVVTQGTYMLSTAMSLLICVIGYSWMIWQLALKSSLKMGRLRRRILESGGELCLDCQAPLGDSHGKKACEQCGTRWDIEQFDQMKRDWLEKLPPHWEEDVAIPARGNVTATHQS